jgi:hypothetical protein
MLTLIFTAWAFAHQPYYDPEMLREAQQNAQRAVAVRPGQTWSVTQRNSHLVDGVWITHFRFTARRKESFRVIATLPGGTGPQMRSPHCLSLKTGRSTWGDGSWRNSSGVRSSTVRGNPDEGTYDYVCEVRYFANEAPRFSLALETLGIPEPTLEEAQAATEMASALQQATIAEGNFSFTSARALGDEVWVEISANPTMTAEDATILLASVKQVICNYRSYRFTTHASVRGSFGTRDATFTYC